MDIISISVSKLMIRAAIAEATPDNIVATTGVPVNGNIWLKDLIIFFFWWIKKKKNKLILNIKY